MPETKRPLKVFLCHAHSDAAVVRTLYSRLKREGVDVWLDKEKLLPGSDWELEIRKAVREADVVVVCLSKQFNQAGFRQKEVRIALDTAMEQPEGEIFIIPARLEECENLESLSKWHWVDLFEADGYHKLIRALRARADRIGATLRIHRGGQSTISRRKNNEPEKTIESSTSTADIGSLSVTGTQETQNSEKVEDEAAEKTSREQEEHEKTEKAAREKLEREAAENARREDVESEAEKAAHEKSEREDKKNFDNIQHEIPVIKRKYKWERFLSSVRYRLAIIRVYSLPIMFLLIAIAASVYFVSYLPKAIPILTQTPANNLTLTSQPILTSTVELTSIATDPRLDTETNVLYDIDFEPPIHTEGSKPVIGAGSNSPSKIVFGEPIVTRSFAPISSQCLVFNTHAGSYDQIQLDMNYGYIFYNLSFDIVTQGLVSGDDRFTMLFDFVVDPPTFDDFNRVVFSGSGVDIDDDQKGEMNINSDKKYHISVDVDFLTRMIIVYVDNELVKRTEIINGSDIKDIRFSMGNIDSSANLNLQAVAAIDNIQVSGK